MAEGSGKILDTYTGKHVKFTDAMKRGLLNPHCYEVVENKAETTSSSKLPLSEGVKRKVIDEATGLYQGGLTLHEALEQRLILSPLTLKECDDKELILKDNTVKNFNDGKPGEEVTFTLLEAVRDGLVDADLKSVRDAGSGQYLSLTEAIRDGVVLVPEANYRDTATGEVMSLNEAVKQGNLMTVTVKTIFNIEGIKDPASGDNISFNKALEDGMINIEEGLFKAPSEQEGAEHEFVSFVEAGQRKLIQAQLLDMLKKPVGLSGEKKKDMCILEAVMEKRIDPATGLLLDKSGKNIPMERALQSDQITPRGAAVLKSLLNITVTTATVTHTVRRQVKLSSGERPASEMGARAASVTSISSRTSSASASAVTRKSSLSRRESRSKKNSKEGSPWRTIPIVVDKHLQDQQPQQATSPCFEVPKNGFSLEEALSKQWFDAESGNFTFPGSQDRITFRECIERKYIDHTSSYVSVQSKSYNLKEALEHSFISETGQFSYEGQTMSLTQAFSSGFVKHSSSTTQTSRKQSSSSNASTKSIKIQRESSKTTSTSATSEEMTSKSTSTNKKEVNGSANSEAVTNGTKGSMPVTVKVAAADEGFSQIIRDSKTSIGKIHNVMGQSEEECSTPELKRSSRVATSIVRSSHRKSEERDRGGKMQSPKPPIKGQGVPESHGLKPVQLPTKKGRGGKKKKKNSASSEGSTSSSSSSSSGDLLDPDCDKSSFRSELTIELDCSKTDTDSLITSPISESWGHTVTSESSSHHQTVTSLTFVEACSRKLINLKLGTFTSPQTGASMPISEAYNRGFLKRDESFKARSRKEVEETVNLESSNVSLTEAFSNHFVYESRTFIFRTRESSYTLEKAVTEKFINGCDVIYDVSSKSHFSLTQAVQEGKLDGTTCDFSISGQSDSKLLFTEALDKGLVFAIPERVQRKANSVTPAPSEKSDLTFTLRETIENGVFRAESARFLDITSQSLITLEQAVSIGLIDVMSVRVKSTKTNGTYNLAEAMEANIVSGLEAEVRDTLNDTWVPLMKAYEMGLLQDASKEGDPFDSITLWEAVERDQLDIESGMFISVHEERKEMTLEEAIYRRYINKKNAFVKDMLKKKYATLTEAARKKIIKQGRIMNTNEGKYLSIREAIEVGILLREVRCLTLIEVLDFGMYQPHSGKVLVPGCETEVTLSEVIEMQVVDITQTLVKSRKTQKFITTQEAIRVRDIDPLTGMYGNINLLEARNKGYIMTIDAMVSLKGCFKNEENSRLSIGQAFFSTAPKNLKTQRKNSSKKLKDSANFFVIYCKNQRK